MGETFKLLNRMKSMDMEYRRHTETRYTVSRDMTTKCKLFLILDNIAETFVILPNMLTCLLTGLSAVSSYR